MSRGGYRSSAAAVLVAGAIVAAASSGPAGAGPDALGCDVGILPEPSHTRGRSNMIRWERIPSSCWENDDASGKKSTERRFVVTITNTRTGAKDTVTVKGDDEVDATVDADEFPGGPSAIDGQQFSYTAVYKERVCVNGIPQLGICERHDTWTTPYSNVVTSTQDDRAPSGSLVLAGGRAFVSALEVPAAVTAADPGGPAASGPGYVAFGGTSRRGGCSALIGCAEPLGPALTVRLEPGPDGPRTVEARVYDRARGPADDPGETTIGTPPGNVSAPFRATVFLDRTPPSIVLRASTVRVMAGVAVTFDASQTVDIGGGGVQPESGEWAFGDGGRASGLVATHRYATTGVFSVAFSVADQAGNVARSAPVEVEVFAVPVPPQPKSTETPPQQPPPPPVADRRPPTLSALSVRRHGGRATIAFRLSERALVRVEVRRVLPRPARRLASLSRRLAAGRRGIALPRPATTKPGRYVIVLVAHDQAGNASRARSVKLRTP